MHDFYRFFNISKIYEKSVGLGLKNCAVIEIIVKLKGTAFYL